MRFLQRVKKGFLSNFIILITLFFLGSGYFQDVKAQTRPSLLCVEAVWCNIAQQIGGDALKTTPLLTASGLNPHHFQPSPSLWRSVGQSDGFLVNGATYDNWALSFHKTGTDQLVVAQIGKWHEGDDPHLFFDPDIMKAVAVVLEEWLIKKAPQNQEIYQANLKKFEQSLDDLKKKLASFKKLHDGVSVALTEPAGTRLLSRTGLVIIDQSWAISMMNQTGVSARETAKLEEAFKHKKIQALIINPAVKSVQINSLLALASQEKIPLVEIQETLPAGLNWQEWMTQILEQLSDVLSRKDQAG